MTKSLTWLSEGLLLDSSNRCGTDTHRDIVTMHRRVKHEGVSFLTIVLPKFCKDFERSLEQGFVDSKCFLGFRRHRALPSFLRGLLSLVFDGDSGKLLNEPSVEAIFSVRQLCLALKKVYLPCSETRTREAYNGFVQCEHELRQTSFFADASGCRSVWHSEGAPAIASSGEPELQEGGCDGFPLSARVGRRGTVHRVLGSSREDLEHQFGTVSDMVWSGVLGNLNRLVEDLESRPRHGPGATAERISGNKKFTHRKWHQRLEPFFPFTAFGIPSLNALDDRELMDAVEFVEPGAEQPVRVISVPKTLATVRIIAIEPVCMQYTQQGLLSPLVEAIEKAPLTAGHINFSDQSINRELAFSSSLSREFGTIDLKDASDRVHKDLVFRMLQTIPALRDAVFACRSTSADVEGWDTIQLTKFASMGSALCFPIESMVFFTLCILGRLHALNLSLTSRNVKAVARGIYVYGDDLLVPSDEVPAVTRALEAFALKVNSTKTFYRGSFRESCGMDAYAGVDVTPVYVRHPSPSDRHSATEIVSYVSLANQLYRTGSWVTARRVRDMVETLTGPLPHVLDTSPALGWHSYLGTYSVQRWNSNTHSFEVRGKVPRSTDRRDPLEGYGALMKFFLHERGFLLPFEGANPLSEKSLSQSVRRGTANINTRWVQPY